MAYTNSPENNTYKTIDLDFTATPWPRDSTSARDPQIINMLFDRNSNENQTRDFTLVKRGGLSETTIGLQKVSSTNLVNGVFQDPNTGYIYWATAGKVYRFNGSTITNICTFSSSVSRLNGVHFCLFLTSTGTRYLMMNNTVELWYHDVTSGSSTQVTDADYPALTTGTMVFLDGYLFVIKAGTGDIYNSNLDDPTAWTAGDYITSEINPDFALTLAKVKNYLVCFGNDGIEFFYDAANPSGSPLARNESYYKSVTLQSSVCTVGDELYFIGRQRNQTLKLFKLDGNNLQDISPSWVNRYLTDYIGVNFGDVNTMNSKYIFPFSSNGHQFIGINLGTTFFLVLDIEEGFWYRWSFGPGFSVDNNQIQGIVRDYSEQKSVLVTGGQTYFLALDDDVYQDIGANFTCSYTTEDYTGKTFNWKSCHRMGLHCDSLPDISSAVAMVSWSDDDGKTYSTARSLSVKSNNPYINQCGRFRTRNWKITFSDAYPFRMWGLSMDINVGTI